MASIDMKLNVSADGLKGLVELSGQFYKNMQAGAAAAAQQSGGTAGSRAISNSTSASSSTASKTENNAYNLSRGIGSGSTGSATSDFAKQAQGLGGLVHLYATFAANIFAAEAAFKALSEAMNTMHLVQGLDQLSAQSGKALGTLAMQLTKATDGAISLKESMTSTANASAAGMTNDQILKMGEVAKKASQALGWDMADAMDRLTKGISKNRPQLLDELGILVNANTIYGDYAKSVGKSTASLSDFEKKQAFANAVLKQGLDKFSAIDIPTNPFTKLEASMSNVAQSALGLVDKVLGPIVKILAESPVALATVMAGIATMLISKALPALGAWREGLASAATASAAAAKKIHDNFEAFDIGRKLSIGGDLAKQATAAANDAVAGVQTALGKAFTGKSSLLTNALSGSYDAAAAQKGIDAQTKAAASKLTVLQEQRALIAATDVEHLAAMDKDIAKQGEKLGQLKQAAMYNSIAAKEQKVANDIMNSAESQAAMEPKFGTEAWQRQKISNRAASKAQSSAIMSNVGSNTQNMGVSAAFSNLKDDINKGAKIMDDTGSTIGRVEGKLGTLAKGAAYAGGTMRILGAAATTAISAFMPWIIGITLAVAVFETFNSIMSKAAEQQVAFDEATAASTSNVKVAADAVTYLADKSKNMYSLEGITSMANALAGVTDGLHNQIKAYDDLVAKSGTWDNIKNSFSKIWGGDNLSKLTNSISKDIPAALNTLVLSSQSAAAKADISSILKIKPEATLSIQAIESALEKFSGPERLTKIRELSDALANINLIEQNSASAVKAFSESLGAMDKSIDVVVNKLQFTDGPGKLGTELVDSAHKMTDALKDPIKGLTSLQKLAGDAKALSLLPPDTADRLIAMKSGLDDLVTAETTLKKQIADNNNAIAAAKGTSSKRGGTSATSGLAATATDLNSKLDQLQIKIKKVVDDSAGVALDMYKVGAEQIQLGLKNALASASLVMAKADLSIAAAAGLNTANEETSLKIQELEIQKRNVQASFELQKRILENTEKLEISNEYKAIEIAMAQKTSGKTLDNKPLDATAIGVLDKTIVSAAASIREISIARSIRGGNKDVVGIETTDVTNAKTRNSAFDLNDVQKASAVAGLNAQEYAAQQAGKLSKLDEETKNLQSQNKLLAEKNSLDLQSLTNIQAQVGGYSQVLESKKNANLLSKAEIDREASLIPLLNTQAKLALVTHPKDQNDYDTKKLANATSINDVYKKFQETTSAIEADTSRKTFVQSQKEIADSIALQVVYLDNFIKLDSARISLEEQKLGNTQALNKLDDITYANRKADLDTQKLQNQYSKDSVSASAAIAAATAAQTQLMVNMVSSQDPSAFKEQLVAAQNAVDIAKSNKEAIEGVNATATAGIGLTLAHNIALAEQKAHLSDIALIGTNLATIFGSVGTELGGLVSSLDSFTKTSADGMAQVAAAQKKYNDVQTDSLSTTKDIDNAEKNLSNVKRRTQAQDLAGTAGVLGATKKMFDQKSTTYKTLDAMEKASAAFSLATQLDTAATKIGIWWSEVGERAAASIASESVDTTATISGFAARLPTYISEIYASWGKMGPWMVGAASLFIASQLGGGGGGSQQTYAEFTGTQNNGSGAVFGDSTKPDESIKNSLDLLSSVAKPELEYSSKMVMLLANIDSSLSGATNSLIAGGFDASGSAFKGVASSTANIGSSIPLIGGIVGSLLGGGSSRSESFAGTGLSFGTQTIGEAANKISVKQYVDKLVQESSSGFLGMGGSSSSHYERNSSAVSDDATAAFSRAITNMKQLTIDAAKFMGVTADVGTKLDGLATDLGDVNLAGTSAEIQAKLTAVMSKLGSKMASSAVSGLEPFMKTGEGYLETLMRVSSGIETATMYTDKLGITTADYTKLLNKQGDIASEIVRESITSIETTTKKTGTGVSSILGGILGSILDTIVSTSTSSVSSIGKIIQTFQGTAEELTNLYTSLIDVKTTFKVLGISSESVSSSLLKGAGGIDALTSGLDSFQSNFLDSAEQTAIKQAKMDAEFNKLGKSTPKTAAEFKELVLSLKDGGDATAELLGKVLVLSSGMTDLIGTATKTLTAAEKLSAQLDQSITIYGLLGDSEAVLALQRKKELDAMDASLQPTQKYIYALQDEASIRTKLTTSINGTVSSLKTSIKTLKDYNNTLTMGASSTLDPTQKYQQSKQSLTDLQAIISGPALTAADQAAQADAVSKFPAASDAFLNASKVLFSSSAQYSQDFQTVTDFVTTSSAILDSQKTSAELQLEVLTNSATSLGIIATATTDTSALLLQYVGALQAVVTTGGAASLTAIPAHANGGLAYGVSLVGEKGPELVDFSTPARVYSNQNSKGMFNTDDMVAELKALRQELAQLRQEQQEQTGHIIATNYDANQQAAITVADATADASVTTGWGIRSAPIIK